MWKISATNKILGFTSIFFSLHIYSYAPFVHQMVHMFCLIGFNAAYSFVGMHSDWL